LSEEAQRLRVSVERPVLTAEAVSEPVAMERPPYLLPPQKPGESTDDFLWRMCTMGGATDAYFKARSMLIEPILGQHRDLRRKYRRELKKSLEKSYLAGVEHLHECERCRAWFSILNRELTSILETSEKLAK
jgi:hypothetical protein